MSSERYVQLPLSLQMALIDSVPPNMVAVTAKIEESLITIHAFFDGPIAEEEEEIVGVIGTEVIADFPAPYTIEEQCFSITDNALQMLDFWAFKRMVL